MQRWTVWFALAALCCLIALGCSKSASNPLSPPDEPGITGESPSLAGRNDTAVERGTYLWGYYDLFLDVEEMSLEAVPNRAGMFTANVTRFLNMNPPTLSFAFNGVTPNPGYVDVDVDISITHPLGLDKFNGYDVKGVFVGNGSELLDYGLLAYPVAGVDQILMNADGYTRWFNPTEFGTSGLFGYTQGLYASKNYSPSATLNPYKYFGEGLDKNDDLWGYLTSGDPEVGYFVANSTNTRNYQLRFPTPSPGIKYGYAVVADWTSGQPADHPSHCPEAVAVSVVDNSDLWYVDEDEYGGDIRLDITVFDWDAEITSVCTEEYSIVLESEVIMGAYFIGEPESEPIASGDHWYTYRVDVDAEEITGLYGNEVWIIIEDANAHYDNPFGISNDAEDEPVAACFRFPLTVLPVQPPWIEVISPDGGEQWLTGETQTIQWIAADSITNVNISLSLDSGGTYTYTIIDGTEDDGSHAWEIPPEAVGGANRIKIEDAADPDVYDESDADFSVVQPMLTVVVPNGGEEWEAGGDFDILWTSLGINSRINLFYSTDDFVSEIVPIASSEENDGIYQWENIPGLDSETVKVRVETESGPLYQDDSDDYFTVYSSTPTIEVTYPNGGEGFIPGDSEEITWTSVGVPGNVDIEYSKDGFVSDINSLATGEANDGSFTWDPIPLDPSNTVRVRVLSSDDPMIFDISDADFTIHQPTIILITPNGGEQLVAGQSYEITWESEYLLGTVMMSYSKDDFVSDFQFIAWDEPNDGSYMWDPIPFDPSTTVKVGIASTLYPWPQVGDSSDDNFEIIEPSITVTSPNGGEILGVPGNVDITWTSSNLSGDVDIEWSRDNFVSDINEVSYNEPNDGLCYWEFPCVLSDTVRVRVLSPMWPSVYDVSDGDFTLEGIGWASSGGTMYDDIPLRVAVDSEGSSYSGGYEDHTGIPYFSLTKLDPCGEYEWGYTWGEGSYNQYGYDVAVDENDNVYMAGYFTGTANDFDPTGGYDPHTSNYNYDCCLMSFDSDGNYRYGLSWGSSTGADEAFGVCCDKSGYFYVTGFFFGNVDFDPGPGTYFVDSGWYSNAFIVKFDTSGSFQWVKTWGGDGEAQGRRIFADSSGNVACTGYWYGSNIDFDPGGGTDLHTSYGGGGNWDIMVTMFDNTGVFQWANTFGDSGADVGNDVWIDSGGNVYTVGYFQGTVDFDPDPVATDTRTYNGGIDCWLSRFDSSGEYYWVRTWGGTGSDNALAVCVNNGSTVYVAGGWENIVDFDPDLVDTDQHTAVGGQDCSISAFSISGDYSWVRLWGGGNNDAARGFAMHGASSGTYDVFCVGTFEGSDIDFANTGSPCFEPTDLHTSDAIDGFTLKIMYDGCW